MLKRTLLTYSFQKAEGKNNLNSMNSIWNSQFFFYTILFFKSQKTKNYFYTELTIFKKYLRKKVKKYSETNKKNSKN